MMDTLDLEIDCVSVKQLLDQNADFVLLDCREPMEHDLGTIDGAMLLPMSELVDRREELSDQAEQQIVVYCHHGMRSLQVAQWLRQQGFSRAQSMAGGIDRWSLEIDPGLTRY